jgi:paraquat-inducible protein A
MTEKHLNLPCSETQISQIACPDCDLILSIPPLAPNEVAHCIRCHATLFKNHKNSINRALAFAITGLILFVISNLFPLLSLKAIGLTQESSLLSTATVLFQQEQPLLAVIMLLTTFIFPATTLLGTIYVLLQVKTNYINSHTATLFRFLRSTDAWGMLEIFMLAILVSMVKLGDVADVIYGVSLYAFCLLILSLTLLSYSLNPHDVWNKLRYAQGCQ